MDDSPPQRATLVLEHVSVTDDEDFEAGGDPWCVVAYLVLDSGARQRTTLCRCATRAEAGDALNRYWRTLIG